MTLPEVYINAPLPIPELSDDKFDVSNGGNFTSQASITAQEWGGSKVELRIWHKWFLKLNLDRNNYAPTISASLKLINQGNTKMAVSRTSGNRFVFAGIGISVPIRHNCDVDPATQESDQQSLFDCYSYVARQAFIKDKDGSPQTVRLPFQFPPSFPTGGQRTMNFDPAQPNTIKFKRMESPLHSSLWLAQI